MPDYKQIYREQADLYEALVQREDYQGNLLSNLNGIHPLQGLDVVELGAGTGRLTCLMAPHVKSLRIFDASQHMLDVAVGKLRKAGWQHWQAQAADHLNLPVEDACADLVISGWSLCYAALDHPDHWRAAVDQALGEMQRVLRPGGVSIILETQGTGFETPHPPGSLLPYLSYLDERGLQSTWFRTDFKFASIEEAERLIRFFFGDQLAEETIRQNWIILPECTGMWWSWKAP